MRDLNATHLAVERWCERQDYVPIGKSYDLRLDPTVRALVEALRAGSDRHRSDAMRRQAEKLIAARRKPRS